jgi:ankyrin repeat protein
VEILKVLAHHAASVDTPDGTGHIPLHMCVSKAGDAAAKCKCISILERYGAVLEAKDLHGLTALHFAADSGNLAAMKALV